METTEIYDCCRYGLLMNQCWSSSSDGSVSSSDESESINDDSSDNDSGDSESEGEYSSTSSKCDYEAESDEENEEESSSSTDGGNLNEDDIGVENDSSSSVRDLLVRSQKPFVGIQNPGALCYLISSVQLLARSQPLRRMILNFQLPCVRNDCPFHCRAQLPTMPVECDPKLFGDISCFSQLQLLFSALSSNETFPKVIDQLSIIPLTRSITCFDGSRLRVSVQRDASDILSILLNVIHRVYDRYKSWNRGYESCEFHTLFGGHLNNRIFVSKSVFELGNVIDVRTSQLEKNRHEKFYFVSVDVGNGITSLEQSLSHFTREEELTMSWQVSLKESNIQDVAIAEASSLEDNLMSGPTKTRMKLPTIKHTLFNSAPQTLVLHLKRFEYDFTMAKTVKIDDHFDVPMTLNLASLLDPLLSSDLSSNESLGTESMVFIYRLVGIIIHQGTASSGHYFCLLFTSQNITEPPTAASNDAEDSSARHLTDYGSEILRAESPVQSWWKLDDDRVKCIDIEAVREICRTNAFLLLYEKT